MTVGWSLTPVATETIKVIELKTRSVTICTLHACNKTETSMIYNTKNWQKMSIVKTLTNVIVN